MDKQIELEIVPNARRCRVLYGGEDLSGIVRRIEVVAEVGRPTVVRLEFVRGIGLTHIRGVLQETAWDGPVDRQEGMGGTMKGEFVEPGSRRWYRQSAETGGWEWWYSRGEDGGAWLPCDPPPEGLLVEHDAWLKDHWDRQERQRGAFKAWSKRPWEGNSP